MDSAHAGGELKFLLFVWGGFAAILVAASAIIGALITLVCWVILSGQISFYPMWCIISFLTACAIAWVILD